MTAPQSPLPPPDFPHVMTHDQWKRHLAMHYTLMAKLAEQDNKKEKS